MVKITNAEVQNLINCFEEISNRHANFPVKIWYSLGRNKDKLDSLFKASERARIKIVEKYGEPTAENASVKQVPKEKMPEFQKEYLDLMEMEVEIDPYKIKLSLLESEVKKMEGVRGMYSFFNLFVEDDTKESVQEIAEKAPVMEAVN